MFSRKFVNWVQFANRHGSRLERKICKGWRFFRLGDRNDTERNVEDYRAVDFRSTLNSRASIIKSDVEFLYSSSYIRIISRPSVSIPLDLASFICLVLATTIPLSQDFNPSSLTPYCLNLLNIAAVLHLFETLY